MTANNLVAHQIPLHGKHLIEASAGTGKTFNITRIYLRLLLEKRLTVSQILVMTFTKDATEEIRGRIDAFIRESLNHWDERILTDDYYLSIASHISSSEAKILLKQALLYLDEASIFTIHGFCKRVLSEHAFSSGQPFSLAMETDCNDVVLESCQDWYRVLAHKSPESFSLVSEFWQTPSGLLSTFGKAISRDNALDLIDETAVITSFNALVRLAIESLTSHHSQLVTYLVDVKKGADREKRLEELATLISWLEALVHDINTVDIKIPDAFIDGKRYARSVHKVELLDIFQPVKQVKALYTKIKKNINRAKALDVVREGIYQIRQDIDDKKIARDLVSFDDLISRLAKQLTPVDCIVNTDDQGDKSTNNNQLLAELLFKQYPVALVDEFQDTDPQQFNILKAIYYKQSEAALYMIGDPKQAIYGFRGGDVFAYLAAREGCDYQWIMDTNWRSSESMIQGYNRLFYGNNLADSPVNVFNYGIEYSPVKASPNASGKTLINAKRTALQFVHFESENEKKSVNQGFRSVMAQWCANEIVDLLADFDASDSSTKINPENIAILVRDRTEAADIKHALDEANLASVFMGTSANLLHSPQASQLIQVLKGVLFVENDRLFTAALASELLGFTPAKLYALQQDEFAWEDLKISFSQLRDEWEDKGFIGMALKLLHESFTEIFEDKDRVLTNILHLFELLQSSSQRHKQPQELLHWFEHQVEQETPDVEAELRLESDDNLIKIVTQHGSKGLEYPIVFVPYASRYKDPLSFGRKAVTFIEYHNAKGELTLSLDGTKEAKKSMADEAYAESVRLLYVAVTRAEQRCYLLTVDFDKCEMSPLGRTLKWKDDTDIKQSLSQLTQDNPNDISVISVDNNIEVQIYHPNNITHAERSPEKFTGKIERDWWLSSFSALSRNLKHKGISSPDRDNEVENSELLLINNIDDFNTSQLRFVMEKGARTGNLLHNILELLNFTEPNWVEAFEWPLARYGEFPLGYTHADLQHWLEQVLEAPLNKHSDINVDFSLASLPNTQCIRESEFYFPMSAKHTHQLTDVIEKHRNKPSFAGEVVKATRGVQLPHYQKLKGMMHGFIDLIFEHEGKFYVCDYKSTFLGDQIEAYTHQVMKEDIEHNHYDLQYLIYSLALHRYLTFALPDYDAKTHFGGIYYLYLRGLTNNPSQTGNGVYYRSIDVDELIALDSVFKGESTNV